MYETKSSQKRLIDWPCGGLPQCDPAGAAVLTASAGHGGAPVGSTSYAADIVLACGVLSVPAFDELVMVIHGVRLILVVAPLIHLQLGYCRNRTVD
jgi:hypothetical protein